MTIANRFKLGRKARLTDSRTLQFAKYAAALPAPPHSADWTKGQDDWGMMMNSELGCCTISAVGHAVQVFTLNTSGEITVSDQVIENYYQWWDGYVPGDPSTDQGGIPLQVLSSWRKHGFNGNKLKAFVGVDTQNLTEIKQSISLLGGAYIGLIVPNYVMQNLTAPGSTWDVDSSGDNSIAGGHAVWACGYRSDGSIIIISWGGIYYVTPAFWAQNMDESYALLSPEWFTKGGPAASGFAFNQLWQDLAQL